MKSICFSCFDFTGRSLNYITMERSCSVIKIKRLILWIILLLILSILMFHLKVLI